MALLLEVVVFTCKSTVGLQFGKASVAWIKGSACWLALGIPQNGMY